MDDLYINSQVQIPLLELEFTYARSGGPGGQNVNKVSSKAILRWNPSLSPSLPEPVRARFLSKYASRLTVEGELVLSSQKYRDQARNVADCLEKLRAMLVSTITPPKPRRATKPTFASKQRRVQTKRAAGEKKQRRQRPSWDD